MKNLIITCLLVLLCANSIVAQNVPYGKLTWGEVDKSHRNKSLVELFQYENNDNLVVLKREKKEYTLMKILQRAYPAE